jgi:vacuolar-type H+-ATPase subunit E/Vma4
MFDIKKAKEEAAKEIADELLAKAKTRYKDKMRALAMAKKVITNLEKELEDLDHELGNDLT